MVLQLLAQKTGVDLNLGELKQLVGREISSCLQPSRQHHLSNAEQQQLGKLSSSTEQLSKPSSAGAEQLPKLSSDVTLTKVAAPERLSEKDKETKVPLHGKLLYGRYRWMVQKTVFFFMRLKPCNRAVLLIRIRMFLGARIRVRHY